MRKIFGKKIQTPKDNPTDERGNRGVGNNL